MIHSSIDHVHVDHIRIAVRRSASWRGSLRRRRRRRRSLGLLLVVVVVVGRRILQKPGNRCRGNEIQSRREFLYQRQGRKQPISKQVVDEQSGDGGPTGVGGFSQARCRKRGHADEIDQDAHQQLETGIQVGSTTAAVAVAIVVAARSIVAVKAQLQREGCQGFLSLQHAARGMVRKPRRRSRRPRRKSRWGGNQRARSAEQRHEAHGQQCEDESSVMIGHDVCR
mmetsp:Transcript_1353/g.3467  ORF Transcript_1353/g.3467 Transcript_1353/m.3467 type:complete len:225 (-) Transcript_1353:355-1029(-)